MTGPADCALIGKWRITEADLWDGDYLDMMDPAQITFESNGHGTLDFGCLNAALNCEYSHQIIFFNWQGCDEMTEVSGEGSAEITDNDQIEIEFRFHQGDEAILKAKKW